METATISVHDLYNLPALLYLLVAIGIVLAALFMYLMRIRDLANEERRKVREYLDPVDFGVELVFASSSGYLGLFVALHFGLSPPGVVVTSSGCAYLNRSFYVLITKYGTQAVLWLIERNFGIKLNGNGTHKKPPPNIPPDSDLD